MDRQRFKATLIGFTGVFLILLLILKTAGIDKMISELRTADGRVVLLLVLMTLAWLATWGAGLRKILDILDSKPTYLNSFFIMNGAMFFNNVTPFGQAGGEPVTALLISQVTETKYEQSLATISAMDSINFIPSVSLAVVGTTYYVTQTAIGFSPLLLVVITIVSSAIVVSSAYFVWKKRNAVERVVATYITAGINGVLHHVPRIDTITKKETYSRIKNFTNSIRTITTDRQGIVVVLIAATFGWVFQMVALWLSFFALGVSIPLSVVLFAVPVGAIAGITPLPGGAGSIEAVLIGVLSTFLLPVVSGETITAAVLIFRGAVYIIPVLIGGVFTSMIGINSMHSVG